MYAVLARFWTRNNSRAVVIGMVMLIASTPAVATATASTVTFDDLSSPNRPLSGQYPNAVIDWGTGVWYLSGPWSQLTTNSISFNGPSLSSGSLRFMTPQRFLGIDAFNGGG